MPSAHTTLQSPSRGIWTHRTRELGRWGNVLAFTRVRVTLCYMQAARPATTMTQMPGP